MIASVGMTVCKRAATPTVLHVIAKNSMTCVMSVTQSVRSAVMPQSDARRPTTTSTPTDNDIHTGLQRHPHRPMRMNRGKQKSPGESRREASNKQPLFLPLRRMASCGAWRWGWWRRHGGKLVFRQSAPPSTPRRSRHPPPRLFVFMSSTYRRNKWRMRHATRPF